MDSRIVQLCKRARKIFVGIGCLHLGLLMLSLYILWGKYLEVIFLETDHVIPIAETTAIVSFVGGLLYFSRKVYTYLITDKLGRLASERASEQNRDDEELLDSIKSSITGYYFYLGTRPMSSLVVGPIILVLLLGGMTTFSSAGGSTELSNAGKMLVIALSFIAGYSSSNIFDYFSRLGDKIISKVELE